MFKGKSVLGLIPARSGSKGLPGKNTKMLCGKPLIAYSIEVGLECGFVDNLIVSTDSQEIAQISEEYGARVPFIRPSHLALDSSPTSEVVKHGIDFLASNYKNIYDFVMVLEPTSPLRDSNDLIMAMEKLYNHDSAKSIVGISRTENQNPSFLFKIDENSRLSRYENSVPIPTQRQLINEIYYVEGSLYISEISHFNTCNTFYHENTIGYVLPKWKAIEIDDNYDFIMVEALLKKRGDFEFSKKIT